MAARLGLIVGLVLLLGGAWLAQRVQTAGGDIVVEDVRFTGASGARMSALLYVPAAATPERRAPGVLAVHGYINSRETQSGFAIELARRGYVVLALDQTGHGFSAPPAFANGFGGPDGLAYLRALPMVDSQRVGLEGHSMGGWAVLAAAAAQPDGYTSMVLEGSATGVFGAPDGTPTFPRNVAVVFSAYDEFAALMWGVPLATSIGAAPKLIDLFDTTALVEAGRVYGDVATGTARVWQMPKVTHPGDHHSRAAIAHALDWFEQTIGAPHPLSSDDQVWYWKELGTLLMLIGIVVLLIAFTAMALPVVGVPQRGLTPLRYTSPLRYTPGPRLLDLTALSLVGAVTYLPLFKLAELVFPPSVVFPQQITNGVVTWVIGNFLLTALLLHLRSSGVARPSFGELGRAFVAASIGVAATYAALWIVFSGWAVDARVWVLAVKPLVSWHWAALAVYLPPLLLFFPLLGMAVTHVIPDEGSITAYAAKVALVLVVGFVLFLAIQYVPLFAGSTMPLGEPLLTVIAFQFVGLLTIVGIVTAVLQRHTGAPWTGGFVNALFVAWVIVAGQATHV